MNIQNTSPIDVIAILVCFFIDKIFPLFLFLMSSTINNRHDAIESKNAIICDIKNGNSTKPAMFPNSPKRRKSVGSNGSPVKIHIISFARAIV